VIFVLSSDKKNRYRLGFRRFEPLSVIRLEKIDIIDVLYDILDVYTFAILKKVNIIK